MDNKPVYRLNEFKLHSFITSSFDEPVLFEPAKKSFYQPCDSLKIVTAFTDTERISTHIIALAERMKSGELQSNLDVEIVLGMTKSSLSQKKHEDICRLIGFLRDAKGNPKVSCRYICNGQEVHTKMYLWGTKENNVYGFFPVTAFCGSLNYTMNAFYKRRELVCRCGNTDTENSFYYYFKEILPDTMDCFAPDVSSRLKALGAERNEGEEEPISSEQEYEYYDKLTPVAILNVSLLQAGGVAVGFGSGINWGIRPNGTKRDTNQAYIPYNRADKVTGFFPDRIHPTDENCPMFRVLTKDFGSFHMRVAQQGNKALHSVESNAILGQWIRKRIGAQSGQFVTKQMLENYGKTFVTFRKYEDGTYLLDF